MITCTDCGYHITEDPNIFEGLEESYICPKCGYEGYSPRGIEALNEKQGRAQ